MSLKLWNISDRPASLSFIQAFAKRWSRKILVLCTGLIALGFSQLCSEELARSADLPTLTSIRQVHSLSREQANRGYPVRLRGVVTFFHVSKEAGVPSPDQLGTNMFIQDRSGATWVAVGKNAPPLKPGQRIELTGVTAQPGFAPDIVQPRWRVLGSARMPVPVRAEFGRLASTNEDSRWVEVEGIIRVAETRTGELRLQIAMDGGRATGFVPDFNSSIPAGLVDARVRIRGVCGALFNARNQVRGINLFIPTLADIEVIEAGAADPFMIPLQTVASVLRFTVGGATGHRVRIHGVVTLQRRGQYLFLTGSDGSIRVESIQQTHLSVGDKIEAVGFPAIGQYQPLLQEAVFRVVGRASPRAPQRLMGEQLLGGSHDGELVQIDAQLLDRTLTPDEQILIAKTNDVVIQAQLNDRRAVSELMAIEPGSHLRITGICSEATGSSSEPGALRLVLRSSRDIVVLSTPPWWTLQHAVWVFGSMGGLIVAITAWLVLLRRKIREQTQTILRRLESEAALEHRYRELFERNLAGVYRMTTEGRIVDCNDACARILGYAQREELLRAGSEESAGLRGAIAGEVSAESTLTGVEIRLRRHDGREIWVLVNAKLSEAETGALIEGTIVEITELKHTVKTLEERTTYLDALISNNPLAIAVMDPEGRILMCNPAFEHLFLFNTSELIGCRLEECIVPVPQKSEVAHAFEDLAAGATVFNVTRRQRKDGIRIDVEAHGVPLIIDGQIVGCYAIYQDISDRMAAEAALRAAKEASEAANRAKTGFLANISHEIRTPLNGVLLAAELAAAENPSPIQKEYLNTIRTSGESLLLLLNDLLDLSKIEAGKMELQSEDFSIHNCVEECLNLLITRAQQKHLELTAEIDARIPDLVHGDFLRLRQIILNLVGNATKFTERGSITLKAECLSQASEEIVCHFSVQDTGIGIPADKHSLVFREFEQVDQTATRRVGGTGLGLAISAKLVHLLGGTIWLESEVGRGSTFHFTARFGSAVAQSNAPARLNRASQNAEVGRALRILLAEDNPVNQHLAVRLLEKQHHSVTAVSNGKEAVEAASDGPFDVILMDVHMPEMDGIQATRKIRECETSTGEHIPIIAMTASAMKQDRETCLAAGMDDYLSKPISLEELRIALARVNDSAMVKQTRELIMTR